MQIPNLFIVGYPKCGTTSLFDALSRHSEICGASIKEPGVEDLSHFKEPKLQEYLSLFRSKPTVEWRMEATTKYVYYSGAFEEIKRISPDARIILALRSPVDFISSFNFQIWKNKGMKERVSPWSDFEREVFYTIPSQYKVAKKCLDLFGDDRVLIYLYDDLVHSEQKLLARIQSFLNIEHEISSLKKLNESRIIGSIFMKFFVKVLSSNSLSVTRRALYIIIGDRVYNSIRNLFYRAKRNTMDEFTDDQLRAIKERHIDDVRDLSTLLGRDLIKQWDF